MGEMLKMVLILDSKKEIKLVLNPSTLTSLTEKLKMKGIKYFLRMRSRTEENMVLHNSYKKH